MDLTAIAAFTLTAIAIELTPGPNMVWLAIVAATDGRRAGFAAVTGVALGLAVIGVAAAYGLATVIAGSPLAYQALRWAGVAYLLWLAWDGWRGVDDTPDQTELGFSMVRYFQRGLVTNLLNPKAFLFYVAVLPSFLSAPAKLADTLTLTAIYVAVATAIHGIIVTTAGAARDWLANTGRAVRVRRVLSLTLVAVAAWLVWQTR